MSLICSLPLVASLFAACAPPLPFATGYVEGEFILVAPVETTQIRRLGVARGDRIAPGLTLAEMEREDAQSALAEAEARLAEAKSRLNDLLQGKRAEEIRVIEATLASARAQSKEAARQRDRAMQLAARGVLTEAQRDDAVTAAEVAEARVAQAMAELAVARLPARPQAIAQAQAAVAAAQAARRHAQWRLEKRQLSLPVAGTVVDVIRREGEIAGPAAPVLSVLADGAVKLRLYIPETSFEKIAVGDPLAVSCDGCPEGLSARVSYVSDEPEFTPPVIYSLENRQKLVYLIEARPEYGPGDGPREGPETGLALKPGQIVNVALP